MKALGLVVVGLVAGLSSGLLGIGGGIVIVPLLVLLWGLEMPQAVGTSLAVIAVVAVAGALGHYRLQHVAWPVAGWVAFGALAGVFLGVELTASLPADTLRRIFGWFILVMALRMIWGK